MTAWVVRTWRGGLATLLAAAALALAAGALSGVVESPFGYHLILLHEKRPERTVPFAEARERIEQVLSEEHLRQLIFDRVESLRTKAEVKTFL